MIYLRGIKRSSNPNRIQIRQPKGWRNAPTLGYVPQNVFTAEGVASLPLLRCYNSFRVVCISPVHPA